MGWSELIGSRLGDYEIEAEIARGGMSRVYRAHHVHTADLAAIKVMAFGADGEATTFTKRFEHEAAAVQRLDHPNIVKVFAADSTDDFLFIAMQLVTGGTFRQRLGKPMPIAEACSLMIQMARALHHAHTQKVIHRDVKPANMLIDDADPNHLLLADFGIAKIVGEQGVTKTGTAVGTPEYMAPEQAKGEPIDQRADIYGLACVLYETLAGRPPFVGPTALSICYQHVHTRPAYIRGFNPDVPRPLALVIEKALAKNPRERFETAEDFAVALYPFTEPAVHTPRRTAPLGTPPDLDLRGTPGEVAGIALDPATPPEFALNGDAKPPVLDLSGVSARRTPSQPIPHDDLTTRQTREMTPISQPARPRHTRPLQPAMRLKSRPVTTRADERPTPPSDVAGFSTIQTPTPPYAPPDKEQAPGIPGRRVFILLAAAVIVGLIALLLLGHIYMTRGGQAVAPTATTQATLAPTATVTTPTATTSPSPTSLPVTSPIQAATVETALDGSCAANSSFTYGQKVYINICVGPTSSAGTLKVSITVDQTNTTSYTPISVPKSGSTSYYHEAYTGALAKGAHQVKIEWNGQVVKTLTFTVS